MILCALSAAEKLSTGGTTTLLGLGMTFIVLALLIGCVYLVNWIMSLLEKYLKRRQEKKIAVPTNDESAEIMETNEEPDAETLLAIKSVIEIHVRENSNDGKPHDKVTILSVKKV